MEEVLPSIRKHGAYMNEDVIHQTLENPDFLIELAMKLKEEKERKRLAEEKAKILENTIAMDKPYTDLDRKSTRLNSSHVSISYAVFCLKKKKSKAKYLIRNQ